MLRSYKARSAGSSKMPLRGDKLILLDENIVNQLLGNIIGIYGIVGSERSYARTMDFGSLLANTLKTSDLTIRTIRSDLVNIVCFFQKHYRY